MIPPSLGPAREQQQLSAIISSMVEGVLVIDEKDRVGLLNASCEKMFGLPHGQVLGRPFWELIRNRELVALIQKVRETKTSQRTEFGAHPIEERTVYAQAAPLLTEEGAVGGVVVVFHDITSLRAAEKIRREFVANVSHELKTPLTSMKGYLETLQSGAFRDPVHGPEFLQTVYEHTLRLERLIDDLLTLSLLESRGRAAIPIPVSYDRVIQRVAQLFHDRLRQKRQTLRIESAKGLEPICVEAELEQALVNLVDNAHKYTPEGGTMTIRSGADGQWIWIAVTDTGIGIPPEHQGRIFERFYRVDPSRSRELGGTGLGLSIVKHIIEGHQGTVSVESAPGKGSTFTIRLPGSDPSKTDAC